LSAAIKKNMLDDDGYAAMISSTTKLNTPGKKLSELAGVHALTDVTGFGLLGHLLELARGSGLQAHLNMNDIPFLPQVQALAEKGCITGASERNWLGYGNEVDLAPSVTPLQVALLTDPQTAVGLLVSCAPEAVEEVLALFHSEGFEYATVVGNMKTGTPSVQVV